ncbi:MAG: S-methyl-5-thioribose-1-phosphate isomerase [Candidatus Wallbacteria bacterium]|nr:S-methyl-5-thioribose-1-phosphate isomerase [Candidatus Wallbacteria bacterium]
MKKKKSTLKTLFFEKGVLFLLNQLKLPLEIDYLPCSSEIEVADAIRNMVVRGAPAIGVTAGYGMALAASRHKGLPYTRFRDKMQECSALLYSTRPTAVNLSWALKRMEKVWRGTANPVGISKSMLTEASLIEAEDVELNRSIGKHGSSLIKNGTTVLTHCNAGALATAGWGTALGVIRSAHEAGKKLRVFIDETRPYLQGARITALEIMDLGIDCRLICDNMAGHFMAQGEIDCVIVGADRIAANGDTANKIGTYSLAVLCRFHKIPIYIAAPCSTLDLSVRSGADIPIEQRAESEVTEIAGKRIAPLGIKVLNPSFDVTPACLISAIITEKGVIRPPYRTGLKQLF